MGNKPKEVTGSALSASTLLDLRQKSVKPNIPTTKEEFEDEIHNLNQKIIDAEDQILRIKERRERGNLSMLEMTDDLYMEENYQFDIEQYTKSLQALETIYEQEYGEKSKRR